MAQRTKPALRVGVVGTGALGRHHVRILSELDEAELVAIFDTRPEVAAELAAAHHTRLADSFSELVSSCDAVVLAVPTADHARLGIEVLRQGRHLLVEKPMASSLQEADDLLAARGASTLAVGHVEFYNPAVQALLDLGERPRFLEVQRLSTFSPRSLDVDVVLDLMIHDLQIVRALDASEVREVRALGIDVLSPRIDLADVRLELASGCVVRLVASRVSDRRVRTLRMFGERRYLSLDYQEQTIKGFRLRPDATVLDAASAIEPFAPEIVPGEPLRLELAAFVDRCRGGSSRLVDGGEGRAALALALEITERIASQRRS